MDNIHKKIGNELQVFGGHLECQTCKKRKVLGSVSSKLSRGWPKCCGYTMRWITQSQITK